MKYLSEEHENLTKTQSSKLMSKITQLQFDTRMAVLATCLISGILTSAVAWQGSSSEKVYFCVQVEPEIKICEDENNRPMKMTRWHWNKWEESGRDPRIIFLKSELPSNPYKPFQAGWAFISFALAGWMFRQFQFDENRKFKLDEIANKRDIAIANLETQVELLETTAALELSACDNAVIIQQAELLGELEVKITQMEIAETIFEAETAGMSEEQKQEYVNFIRRQKTPYLTGNQTLDKTTNPKDKIDGDDDLPVIAPDVWVNNLIRQTALIWGNPGGGKSWLARYVAKLKKDAGYRVIVLDPDSNRSEWVGVESYHSWDDIEKQISNYVDELESRIQIFSESMMSEDEWRSKLWAEGKATSLIIEEATTYSSCIKNVDLLEKFGKLFLTKSRRQEMPVIVVSHNNTQSCLFGIKGLHNLVSKMLQVECLAEVDRVTLKTKSMGVARVKLDSSNEWLDVELPKLSDKITNFGTSFKIPVDRDKLEEIYQLEFNLKPRSLSDNAQSLLKFLTRTNRSTANISEVQRNFKIKGQRFMADEVKILFVQLVENGLANWLDAQTIELS